MPLDKTRVAELEAEIDDEQVRTQPLPAQRGACAVRPRRRIVGGANGSRSRPARLQRGPDMPKLQGRHLPQVQ